MQIKCLWLIWFVVLGSFITPSPRQDKPIAPTTSADETAITEMVTQFYTAYMKRDVAVVDSLWSDKSQQKVGTMKFLNETTSGGLQVLSALKVYRVKVNGRTALAWVNVELTTPNQIGPNKKEMKTSVINVFTVVKEDSGWKVDVQIGGPYWLAAELERTPTKSARAALLDENKELITFEMHRRLLIHGDDRVAKGDNLPALLLYNIAEEVGERLPDHRDLADTQLKIATAYFTLGRIDLAAQYNQKAFAQYEIAKDKTGMSEAQHGLGDADLKLNNYPQSLAAYDKCLKIQEEAGNQAGAANTLLSIGHVQQLQGEFSPAIETFQKAVARLDALGNHSGKAYGLDQIGDIQYLQGNYREAADNYLKAVVEYEILKANREQAHAFHKTGNSYYMQGDYPAALEYYDKSVKRSEATGSKEDIAVALQAIGLAHAAQGNYDLALQSLQKSLAILVELGDNVGLASAQASLGDVYRDQGNYGLALGAYYTSLKLEDSRPSPKTFDTLSSIGAILMAEGKFPAAVEQYERSLTLAENGKNMANMGRALWNLASASQTQGDYPKALDYYQKSLVQFQAVHDPASVAGIFLGIGLVHAATGEFPKALDYYEQARQLYLSLDKSAEVALALTNSAIVCNLQGNSEQALDFATKAAATAKVANNKNIYWQARFRAGAALYRLNRQEEARQAFEGAITTVETFERTWLLDPAAPQYFHDKTAPYLGMVELLVGQKKPDEALIYAEQAKSRALLDLLQAGRIAITKGMTTAEIEQERVLQNEVVSFSKQIRLLQQNNPTNRARLDQLGERLQQKQQLYAAFEAKLYNAHPDLKIFRGELPSLKINDATALSIDGETALLDYIATENNTYLFVITRQGAVSRSIPTRRPPASTLDIQAYTLQLQRKDLTERVTVLRNTIARQDEKFDALARELYDQLIGPAANQLAGKAAIIVSPDADLWQLPFQALKPTADKYLIENQAVSYALSITARAEMEKMRSSTQRSVQPLNLLAFGNPELTQPIIDRVKLANPDEKVTPLSEAENEAKAVGALFTPPRSKVFLGSEAGEDVMKAQAGKFRLLHFAGHAMIDQASPLFSHIVLAPGEKKTEDGLLEAWEIMQLDLNANLIVLSASELSNGRMSKGNGSVGFAWAVFIAGCPASIMTQWQGDGPNTTRLMVEFYKNLKLKPLDVHGVKSNALRQATLALLKSPQSRQPVYWAAFRLMGD